MTNSLLFTNVKINGESLAEDGVDNVMVFTNLPLETLKAAYENEGSVSFDDACEVPGSDLSFYLYEPCYLTEAEEKKALELVGDA